MLRLLHSCWRLVIESRQEFTIFPRRDSRALRTGGLGLLQRPPDPQERMGIEPCVGGFTRFHELVFSGELNLPSCKAILLSRPDGTFSKIRINPNFDGMFDEDTTGDVSGVCYYSIPEGFWMPIAVTGPMPIAVTAGV